MARAKTGEEAPERVIDPALASGFALEIVALGPEGAPLEGATVQVILTSRDGGYCSAQSRGVLGLPDASRAETDAAGRASWPGLAELRSPNERYVLSLQHPDFAETLVQCPEKLPRRSGVAEVRARLARGARVVGRVVERGSGAPVEGARVMTVLEDGGALVPVCHPLVRSTTTGADGSFVLQGVVAGRQDIRVEHPGYMEVVNSVVVPDEGGSWDIELTGGRVISGRVLDEQGGPAVGAEVSATWFADGGEHRKETAVGENGRFVLRGLAGDAPVAVVARRASPDEPLGELLGTCVLGDGEAEVCIDARDVARISGRVIVGASGSPPPVPVYLSVHGPADRWPVGRAAAAIEDGAFSVRAPAGQVRLLVGDADQSLHASVSYELAPGEHREGVVVAIAQRSLGRFEVVDASTGAPVVGASVMLDERFGEIHGDVILREADELGVAIVPLAAERSILTVYAPRYQKVRTWLEPRTLPDAPTVVKLIRLPDDAPEVASRQA